MKKLIRLYYLLFLLIIPVMGFSQRKARPDSEIKDAVFGTPIPAKGTPIDQYEIALIIMAVSIVAFFAYRFYKSKQIAK